MVNDGLWVQYGRDGVHGVNEVHEERRDIEHDGHGDGDLEKACHFVQSLFRFDVVNMTSKD